MSKSIPDLPARKPVVREPQDNAEEHPPAYSAGPASPPPNASSSNSERPPAQPSPSSLHPPAEKPTVDFAAYAIRGSTFSKDTSSRTLHHAALCSDPAALEKLLEAQLNLPPIPVIRIRGHRREAEAREDFDLRLNCLALILRGPHGRDWHCIKCLEKGELGLRGAGSTEGITPSIEGGLRAWVHRFCEDRSQHKSFTIRRTVTGWDTEALEGQLRTLLASRIGYPGHVQIEFLLTHALLTIHTPNPPGFLDHATSMLFSGKKKEVHRYEPVKSIWPYSIAVHAADSGERRRFPAVKSEGEWFAQWRAAIAMGVCERRKGWISAEDQMDLMLVPERGEMKWPGQSSLPSQPHG